MVTLSHFMSAASTTTSNTSSSKSAAAASASNSSSKKQPSGPTTAQLAAVRESIKTLLHQPDYDDGSAGPVLVRLAWHASGTYCAETKTGGSNGAGMRYESEGGDPANAGLQHARAFLEPVKAKHPWVTYADLWTLASIVAIKEMDGPEIPWKGGRTDFTDDSKIPPRGRLPDAAQGADHIRWIFYRMGFNDQEIVALSGAHNLGRCHTDRSGFEGKWVNNPTRFSNTYFRLLLANEKEWQKVKLANGVEQFVYVDPDVAADKTLTSEQKKEETLMMLPTDIALLNDKEFRPWVVKYAEDKDLFYDHFSKVYSKLLELGIKRDAEGNIINEENLEDGYKSAPKKSDVATAGNKTKDGKSNVDESSKLKEENDQFKKRREGARL